MPEIHLADERERSNRSLTHVIYALYAASFLFGITALIAIIINYVKRDDVRGSWLETHFRWQIRSFWFGLLWAIIGVATSPILVGWLILCANLVWLVYRIVKGWLSLNDNRAMYVV